MGRWQAAVYSETLKSLFPPRCKPYKKRASYIDWGHVAASQRGRNVAQLLGLNITPRSFVSDHVDRGEEKKHFKLVAFGLMIVDRSDMPGHEWSRPRNGELKVTIGQSVNKSLVAWSSLIFFRKLALFSLVSNHREPETGYPQPFSTSPVRHLDSW